MRSYQITNMIIDEDFQREESVTADFTHNNQDFSITFNKADLEIVNAWAFENDTSVPANLSDEIIELIREDVKLRI
ncbi:hypothetical protein GH741_20595 [Aquibacillus halophilus]|uniref:Uncharacterized protein n=1 Tax=Aquibacillus halophilus TaxID=930132 RepID=A0A6A8DH74_9BACI|nr:hypothetical protein [Aquibacillus halophilus]MRH45045.1 hypothetical protein [Aquibacillus halophilus]